MRSRIGLLGGSFDPIHNGHLIVARTIAEKIGLDRIVFLPSAVPPHKQRVALTEQGHRAAMVQLAIVDEPRFEFSSYDLTRGGPSYTIDTVHHFHAARAKEVELFWIIGADWLAQICTWHRAGDLVEACQIVTASRAGWNPPDWNLMRSQLTEEQIAGVRSGVVETPIVEISSTQIRNRVRDGKSISYLVPDSVLEYIKQHHLYAAVG